MTDGSGFTDEELRFLAGGEFSDLGPKDLAAYENAVAEARADAIRNSCDRFVVARGLGLTAAGLTAAVEARDLLTITLDGRTRFPRSQFITGRDGVLEVIPHLREILEALACTDLHPATVGNLFLRPDDSLEVNGAAVSPREWLIASGSVEAVIELLIAADGPW